MLAGRMKRTRHKAATLLLLFCMVAAPVTHSQDGQAGQAGQENRNSRDGSDAEPVPYDEEEFSDWAIKLRRAEVIAVGTFPLAFLGSKLGYDLLRFAWKSIEAGEVRQDYAPWFFGPSGPMEMNQQERRGIIVASISISAAVSLLDFFLGRRAEQAR
jgi:hypothetical protein